jgi:hypothetical protein
MFFDFEKFSLGSMISSFGVCPFEYLSLIAEGGEKDAPVPSVGYAAKKDGQLERKKKNSSFGEPSRETKSTRVRWSHSLSSI